MAEQTPFIHSGTFSRDEDAALSEANGSVIRMSWIIRSAGQLWLAHHRYLMQQGYGALDATRYLIEQTKNKSQPQQTQPPSFVPPQPAPMPSPFQAQPPMKVAANGR
jgi:hypothetical protein